MNGYPNIYQLIWQLHREIAGQSGKLAELEQAIRSLEQTVASLKDAPRTRIDKIEYTFDQLKVEKLEGTLNIGITPGKGGIEELSVPGQPETTGASGAPDDPGAPGGAGAAGSPGVPGGVGAQGSPGWPGLTGGAGAPGVPWAPPGAPGWPGGPGAPDAAYGPPPGWRPTPQDEPGQAGGAPGSPEDPALRQAVYLVGRYLAEELPRRLDDMEREYDLPLGEPYRRLMAADLQSQTADRAAEYLRRLRSENGTAEEEALIGRAVQKVIRDVETAVRLHLEQLQMKGAGNPP